MKQIWAVYGDQWLIWHTIRLELSKPTADFQLVFVCEQGHSDVAVALDNVFIEDKGCVNIQQGKPYYFILHNRSISVDGYLVSCIDGVSMHHTYLLFGVQMLTSFICYFTQPHTGLHV